MGKLAVFNEYKTKLKELYFKMCGMKISKSKNNRDLDELVEKIFELDFYYAGLALSVSEGGIVKKKDLYEISGLINIANSIVANNVVDEKVLTECKNFINTINEIDCTLRKLIV